MAVLKGNKGFYDFEVSDFLAANLKRWLDYGLLEMGAYTNVAFSLPTSGYTNLKRTTDDRYSGTVYEALGPNIVWEPDVNPIGRPDKPIVASGVYVNNTFIAPSASGSYPYYIDYKLGRVIFASGLPTSASVKMEYSFSDVSTYLVDEKQWKVITEGFTKGYDELEELAPSGIAQYLKQNRVWLPAVIIDVGDRSNEPLQLGGGEINSFVVDYHICSDRAFTNRRLCDLLNNQYQTTINLFNLNDMQWPYNYNGTIASGALTYPVLANQDSAYFWDKAFISAVVGGPRPESTDVYRGEITHTVDVDRHMITY
jgi:hypothetical protein